MGRVGVVRSDGPGQRIHDVADPASGQLNAFPVRGIGARSTETPISVAAELIIDVALVHGDGFMDSTLRELWGIATARR